MKHAVVENWQQAGFAVYIHWPFCASKCPYCDFNSHVRDAIDEERWRDAYLHELDRAAELTRGRVVSTIFFGGGTPSLMQPATVDAIITRIATRWSLANDAEITLEANPASADAANFAGYRTAGVNRLSLGLQALNDADLKRLGRLHGADEGLRALDLAQSLFARTSCDLIYARQHQTLDAWRAELSQLLRRAPDHLSLYQLTIEANTAFGARHRAGGLRGLPGEELAADMYDLTTDLCVGAGLAAYEVSNYARPGNESRHNLVYWRMGDYVGIGAGAHGRLTIDGKRHATSTRLLPERWLEGVTRDGSGERPPEVLSREEVAEEYLLMAMRLDEGMSLARHATLGGRKLAADALERLEKDGLITLQGDRLRATRQGRLVLNRLILELSSA